MSSTLSVADQDTPRAPRSAQRQLSERDLAILRATLKDSPRAVGLASDRWSPARVSRLLATQFAVYYSPRHAVRVLRRRGLDLKFKRAREVRLNRSQILELEVLLQDIPSAAGLRGDSWTRKRVAELISRRFNVQYSAQYVGRFVKGLETKVNIVRRERRLTRVQIDTLRELLAQSPRTQGYPSERWSRPLIAALITARFGVDYHVHSIRRMLQRWQLELPPSARTPTSSKLNPEQMSELNAALARTPQENGIYGNIWTQRRVAAFIAQRFGVECRPYAVNRLLARLHIQPHHRAPRGGAMALNSEQVVELVKTLSTPPAVTDGVRRRWTRRSIARFIQDRFHVRYSPASIPRLLRRCRIPSDNGARNFSAVLTATSGSEQRL